MQQPYYQQQISWCRRWAVAGIVLCVLTACNSTSNIDTTLGSVSPVSQQVPLPPPAAPGAEQAASSVTETVAPVTSNAPDEQTALAEEDDLVPNISIRNTGTYPNINVEREPSLQQFTAKEQAQLSAYMEQLRAQHQDGAISTQQYQQQLVFLQNLARTHSRDALRQIGAL